LAAGVFLVVAVAANRHGRLADSRQRSAGSGGYELFAASVLPVEADLNTAAGREKYALEDLPMNKVRFVQMPLREGDDASCLNLNQVGNPHVLGVDPGEFDREPQAFTFAAVDAAVVDSGRPWLALEEELTEPDTIPAVADQTVIVWGLGKKVGDTLEYTDDHGQTLKLKLVGGLANSVFQGHVLISKRRFREHFPSASGTRRLLIDTPPSQADAMNRSLTERLASVGLAVSSTSARLAQFNSVENTYLMIFLTLGGLGVVLGSLGLGVVVLRNVLERRPELAVLMALGFTRRQVRQLIVFEHWLLAGAGFSVGLGSALVAVAPALASPSLNVPYVSLLLLLSFIAVSALFWTLLAAACALRGPLLSALRNE
jgi:hypothetical protein